MHDGAIRAALRRDLELAHPDRADTLIREELGLCLGRTRVDVAVVNGLISGFEIKSPQDTLERLGLQVELYGSVLDRATIVTGGRHVDKVAARVPQWWGLWVAQDHDGVVEFDRVRAEQANPHRDPLAVAQLLWRDEAAEVLLGLGERVPTSQTRWVLWDRLVEALDLDELLRTVRERLKARRHWPGGQ